MSFISHLGHTDLVIQITITQRILTVTEIYIVFFLEVLPGMMCQDLSWSVRPACEDRERMFGGWEGGREDVKAYCTGSDRERQLEQSAFFTHGYPVHNPVM